VPSSNQTLLTCVNRNGTVCDIPQGYLEYVAERWRDSDFHEWFVAVAEELEVRRQEGGGGLEEQADEILRRAGFNKHGRRE